MGFSLSFPLELSAALLFPTPTAAAIAFLGSADAREFRGEVPPLKAVFVRSQIALCVSPSPGSSTTRSPGTFMRRSETFCRVHRGS
jgi:hypothetical protein